MIYLDHAATTPICEAAKQAIINNLNYFGNPSSSHNIGHQAKMFIEDARERIAQCINAEPEEIYFCSGGSEANTWALRNKTCLTSKIEHHSNCGKWWFDAHNGVVDQYTFEEYMSVVPYLHPYQQLISCMYVNNEIGTIQPIKDLVRISHAYNMFFHTDAVQAMSCLTVDVKNLDVDMLSASGHKFGAPKGVGFLYVKNGVQIHSLIYGGKQELGKRGGTENVLGIIAMAAALEDSIINMEERHKHIVTMRNILLPCLLNIDGVYLNGPIANRVASNINVRISGVKGQAVVAMADQYGICISAGSACNEGNAEPSHVLKAIGLTDEEALSSIRITLGHENTFDEIQYVCDILPKIIARLRQIN